MSKCPQIDTDIHGGQVKIPLMAGKGRDGHHGPRVTVMVGI